MCHHLGRWACRRGVSYHLSGHVVEWDFRIVPELRRLGVPVNSSPFSAHSPSNLAQRVLAVMGRISYGLTALAFIVAGGGYALGQLSEGASFLLSVGVTTAVSTILLVGRALAIHAATGAFAACRGVGFLGMGALAGGVSLAVGAVVVPQRALDVVGGGVLVAAALFVFGLLWMPGGVPTFFSRVRRVLDGAVVGTCLFLAGWALIVAPLARGYPEPVGHLTTVGIVLVMVLSVALAVTALTGSRAVSHRASTVFCSVGVAVALFEHVVLALLLLVDAGHPWMLASTAAWAAGLVLILVGAGRSDSATWSKPRGFVDPNRVLATLSPLAVSAGLGLLGALYHLMTFGDLGGNTAVIAISAATAVAVRGAWSAVDLHRSAVRLAAQETHFRTTDSLTGAPNRVRLRHRLEQVRGRVEVGQRCGTLLAVDLDSFGELDEFRGHDVGDTVLMEVARRLSDQAGGADLTVRLAGDAFAVLTTGPSEQAEELAGRLLSALAEPYRIQGEDGAAHVTVSIGLAECNAAASVDEMIRAAELAVVAAQERGGNQIVRYGESLAVRALRRQTYAQELPGAVRRGELDILYQPVVSLTTGAAVALDAEARWLHPVLGAAPRQELATAAEDAGLVGEIGEWTLRAVCRQISRWLAEGRDLWVSVQVSPLQLRTPSFPDELQGLLGSWQIPPQRLALTVSERAMETYDLSAAFTAVKQTGVRTVLAEYGAGHLPLTRLLRMPVDLLKLDSSLVTESQDARLAGELAAALGRRLGAQVIANGVQAMWQADLLTATGCGFAQGTLFSPPAPAERVEAYLDAHQDGSSHWRQ